MSRSEKIKGFILYMFGLNPLGRFKEDYDNPQKMGEQLDKKLKMFLWLHKFDTLKKAINVIFIIAFVLMAVNLPNIMK